MIVEETFFEQLDTRQINNYLVILDVDGCVVADGGRELSASVKQKILALSQNNEIFFCSNKNYGERLKQLSSQAGIGYLDTIYKKPSKKILRSVRNESGKPLLVIGDKFLTDGVWAMRIGARFVKVKRIVASSDSPVVALIYWLDDFVYHFFKKIWNI